MWRDPSAKVGSSAKLCVLVFKASLLNYWGVHLPKCVFSAKCCVLAFKASLLYLVGSIGQSRFICQVLCTGIQGIYALFVGGSIGQRRFVCQVLVLLVGGGVHRPKKVSSANYAHTSKFTLASQRSFLRKTNKILFSL